MGKSNVTRITPRASADVLPPRAVIEAGLEAQLQRIFQAKAIISVVAKVLDHEEEVNDPRLEQPCWRSLIVAEEMLQEIAAQLEPCALLGREVRRGE